MNHLATTHGTGMEVTTVTGETLSRFIHKHASVLENCMLDKDREQVLLAADNPRTCLAKLGSMEDPYTGIESPFVIISLIMTEETGIQFETQAATEDDKVVVMLADGPVWVFNKAELAIESEESFKAILTPYAEELGLPATSISRFSIDRCC